MVSSISGGYVNNAVNYTTSPAKKSFTQNYQAPQIAPTEKKVVIVDGQTYEVKKVPDKGGFMSLMPVYKEVVVIDGQQYDVKNVPDMRGCDLPDKQAVIIDGKQHDVLDGNSLEAAIKGLLA